MSTRTNTIERNATKATISPWSKALIAKSEWPDKDEFLDIIYWSRQVVGIILGIIWGTFFLKGFIALALYVLPTS